MRDDPPGDGDPLQPRRDPLAPRLGGVLPNVQQLLRDLIVRKLGDDVDAGAVKDVVAGDVRDGRVVVELDLGSEMGKGKGVVWMRLR